MPDWSQRLKCGSFLLALLLLIVIAGDGLADSVEPGEQPNAVTGQDDTATGSESDQPDTIMEMISNSGWTGWTFMGVLLIFSIVAAMVAIERAVNTQRSKIIPQDFVDELEQILKHDNATSSRLQSLCAPWTAPIAKVLMAGLLRSGRPVPEVEKSMEDAAAREMAALREKIRPLSVVGNIAPLVGLLGTVLGMIIAFRTASQAGLGKGELMAQGIYMALLTTAAGLSIAIPSLLLSAVFTSRVDKLFREIDESLMNTMPAFSRMEKTEPAGATEPPSEQPVVSTAS